MANDLMLIGAECRGNVLHTYDTVFGTLRAQTSESAGGSAPPPRFVVNRRESLGVACGCGNIGPRSASRDVACAPAAR
jgi:hypothetical protein